MEHIATKEHVRQALVRRLRSHFGERICHILQAEGDAIYRTDEDTINLVLVLDYTHGWAETDAAVDLAWDVAEAHEFTYPVNVRVLNREAYEQGRAVVARHAQQEGSPA
ncbi:MAG: hypothetical protein ACR2GR_11250 [Rhodothermales bacterium]